MASWLAIDAFLQGEGAVLDVRSPAEFGQGHIPGARNLPLFSDDERAEVGTLYKQQGRRLSVLRGLGMVGPEARSHGHPARGDGEANAGGPCAPLLARRDALRQRGLAGGNPRSARAAAGGGLQGLPPLGAGPLFERPWPLKLLGGRTGTGKTDLLLALRDLGVAVVDLEGLANHRGSSFGGLGLPDQPSSEQYENLLARALLPWRGQGRSGWRPKAPMWGAAASRPGCGGR
jgi:tRNA 2-selenouridine synthase